MVQECDPEIDAKPHDPEEPRGRQVRAGRMRSDRIRGMNETPTNRRQQALAGLHRATATITDLFDAKDALHAALASVAAAAGGSDPLRAAVEVGELLPRVADAVAVVQAAAIAASEFEPQKKIAGYLESRVALVFPRPATAKSTSRAAVKPEHSLEPGDHSQG